jgi:hypothetical protein
MLPRREKHCRLKKGFVAEMKLSFHTEKERKREGGRLLEESREVEKAASTFLPSPFASPTYSSSSLRAY